MLGRPYDVGYSGKRFTALSVGMCGVLLDVFSLVYYFSLFSPLLFWKQYTLSSSPTFSYFRSLPPFFRSGEMWWTTR